MYDMTVSKFIESETTKGISGSVIFQGNAGDDLEITLNIRGEKSRVEQFLATYACMALGDVIGIDVHKNAQTKL